MRCGLIARDLGTQLLHQIPLTLCFEATSKVETTATGKLMPMRQEGTEHVWDVWFFIGAAGTE
jgi:hypothetical protein